MTKLREVMDQQQEGVLDAILGKIGSVAKGIASKIDERKLRILKEDLLKAMDKADVHPAVSTMLFTQAMQDHEAKRPDGLSPQANDIYTLLTDAMHAYYNKTKGNQQA